MNKINSYEREDREARGDIIDIESKINDIIDKINEIIEALEETNKKTVSNKDYGWVNTLQDVNDNTQRYAWALNILGHYVKQMITNQSIPSSDSYTIQKGGQDAMTLTWIADSNNHFMNSDWQIADEHHPGSITPLTNIN